MRAATLRLALALCAVVMTGDAIANSDDQEYVVIANIADSEVPASTIRALYLKQDRDWPSGTEARPLRLPAENPAQRALRHSVVEMREDELVRHWLSLKQLSGQVPPSTVPNPRALLVLVRRFEGAFGVVPFNILSPDDHRLVVHRLAPQ